MEKILVVDDEIEVTELIEEFLKESGYQVMVAKSKKELLEIIPQFDPGIVLLDIRLPDGDGIEILKEIRSLYPKIEVIMVTGLADRQIALEALQNGAIDYITKPIDLAYLANSVLAKAVERYTSLNS
jgi:DNA-binding response OmpR family regulator